MSSNTGNGGPSYDKVFRCHSCQDYMYSISKKVDTEALRHAGVTLTVIGNGSPGMIKSYRREFLDFEHDDRY